MSMSSKLTLEQMREIQARTAAGESQSKLAAAFGVHKRTIGRIQQMSEDELLEQDARKRRYKPRAAPKAPRKPREEPQAITVVTGYLYPHIRRGTAVPTREGSYIQRNALGNIVKILSCPIYDGKRRFMARYDVEVTEMSANERTGRGVTTKLDGDVLEGKLVLEYSGLIVKRVEFHPDEMTKEYMRRDRELREGKPAVR